MNQSKKPLPPKLLWSDGDKSFAEGSPDVYEHSKEVLEAARDWYDKAANPPKNGG